MRVDYNRHEMWFAALGMFVLSLLVAIADRTGYLSSVRPVLHDAFSPGRLVVMAVTSRSPISPAADSEVSSTSAVSGDRVTARQLQLLRQLMIENARLRQDLKR